MLKKFFLFFLVQTSFSLPGWGQGISCHQLFEQKVKDMDSLRVAAVQFPLAEGRTAKDFLNKMELFIQEAHINGAQIVVFPELITTELVDWKQIDEIKQLESIAKDFTPTYIKWLKDQSKKLQISILGGTTPRLVDRKIFNTAILALPDGKVILQDKIFLTPDEKNWDWNAGTEFNVFKAPWGKTAIATCFDCEFPIISQMMSKAQPEVILVPSWTSTESGLNRVDWTAKSRAIEHFSFVVKTGTVPDPGSDQVHFGKASIVTPQEKGFPTAAVEGVLNKSSIVYGNLDLKMLREKREKSGYFPDKEQLNRQAPLKLNDDN